MEANMNCQKKAKYCNNQNVKLCQMKSASNPKTVFEGKEIYLCQECRKWEQGQFKFVRP